MGAPTVSGLLAELVDVDDRGVYSAAGKDTGDVSFVSWRNHIRDGAALAALLDARLDPDRPRHVGVLLGNTPFFCTVLVAAALSGIVPVGLNPTRRGVALQRDIAHADCQLVLADRDNAQESIDSVNVESADFAAELTAHHGAPVDFPEADPDDLFMLIFTSGTSGDPKAVRCTHEKVAFPGQMLAQRFGLGPSDTCYLSMPLFHSNAIMAGWAPAVAGGSSIALRRRFSASGFFPDVRRFGATYANYVGKPLTYILATPPAPDDGDNPLRVAYGNEGAPRDLGRFATRFGVQVVDGPLAQAVRWQIRPNRAGDHRAAPRQIGLDTDIVDQGVELRVAVAPGVEGAAAGRVAGAEQRVQRRPRVRVRRPAELQEARGRARELREELVRR